jgi:hypothetical protein
MAITLCGEPKLSDALDGCRVITCQRVKVVGEGKRRLDAAQISPESQLPNAVLLRVVGVAERYCAVVAWFE